MAIPVPTPHGAPVSKVVILLLVLLFLFTCFVPLSLCCLTAASRLGGDLWPPRRRIQGSLPFRTSAYLQGWCAWSRCSPNNHKSTLSLGRFKQFGKNISLCFMPATFGRRLLVFHLDLVTCVFLLEAWPPQAVHMSPEIFLPQSAGKFVHQIQVLLWDRVHGRSLC